MKKLNEVEEKLKTADPSTANYSYSEYSELKRREAVPLMGTYLHEAYFSNMAADGAEPSTEVQRSIESAFGKWADFEAQLTGTGLSAPGWSILTHSSIDDRCHVYYIMEHHRGWPIYQTPLVVMDTWEHAFMIDYGTNRAEYIKAFIQNINWRTVNDRFTRVLER